MSTILAEATRHVKDTLTIALEHSDSHTALLVVDARTALARLLVDAYRECLPRARVLLFEDTAAEGVKAAFAALREKDLVVLIQSSVFRIPEYRTRVELFKRGIKVIEHSNLDRISESATRSRRAWTAPPRRASRAGNIACTSPAPSSRQSSTLVISRACPTWAACSRSGKCSRKRVS
jgi:hypothetical protein